MNRQAHWIPGNAQERMPARMVAFDTESRQHNDGLMDVQTWRMGCGIRWRTDLKTGHREEGACFGSPASLWQWVSDYCHPGMRTVAWAHNLGYDVRISQALTILPQLGWRLEWCNLDRNVSAMTWRSDRGTLVLADTWTWLPLPLESVAPLAGLVKYTMPEIRDDDELWGTYCMRDAEIVYRTVSRLVAFIKTEHLGNWQPTGAGMAYASWRHRFLSDKILVHDDQNAVHAERAAMHSGRAEAWRHGILEGDVWTEVDMRNAYLTIAGECDVPRKLRFRAGRITLEQYRRISSRNRVLVRAAIDTDHPVAACRHDNRILWPAGQFHTWLWDTEIDETLEAGATVQVLDSYVYSRAPVLQEWAQWVMSVLRDDTDRYDPVAKTWLKHCSRALIGRLALRVPAWEVLGDNPDGWTGISHMTDADTGQTFRLMHVGANTLIETMREEGRDSLPQITGWIMAECRRRLWQAMTAAGLENLAHVDTDSLLVNSAGLARLRSHYSSDFGRLWAVKGSWRALEVFGPRSYYRDGRRVMAGIPRKAVEIAPGEFEGERWTALAEDLACRSGTAVTTMPAVWTVHRTDPRRNDDPARAGYTVAQVAAGW